MIGVRNRKTAVGEDGDEGGWDPGHRVRCAEFAQYLTGLIVMISLLCAFQIVRASPSAIRRE